MRARVLGIISIFLGSVCCLVPLTLIALGLTTVGLSTFLVKYHWYLQGAAITIVGSAWIIFLRASRRSHRLGTRVHRERSTRIILMVASAVLVFFLVFASYGVIARRIVPSEGEVATELAGALVTIPVEGMYCPTCELTVQQSLKKIDGVLDADASLPRESVTVRYDPERATIREMVDAINKIGYRAEMPK